VNYGIASLCGIIKDKGHYAFLYQPSSFSLNDFYAEFKKKDYSLCLVSTVTNQWPYALQYIRALRNISDIPIIVGGHHATCCPGIIEENPEINAICIGEGDLALSKLIDRINEGKGFCDVENLWVRNGNEIIHNEIGNLIEDLDALPFPDYSVFSPQVIAERSSILLSRGCPYNCTYCCNNYLRRLYSGKGKYVRKKSVKRAVEEVRYFIEKYNPSRISFDDDTFVKDKKWLRMFLDEYRLLTRIPFDCNSRAETLDDEVCSSLKAANCETLCIGVENGNEQFRKKILNRHMTNESIIKAFTLLRKHGIKSYAFNLVGVPDETYKIHLETVRLNQNIKPDGYQITIFYPYPATDLYNYAIKNNILTNNIYRDSFESESLLQMRQFPRWKISFAKKIFEYRLEYRLRFLDATIKQKFVYLLGFIFGRYSTNIILFVSKLKHFIVRSRLENL
jgi:radical SAM superfamily enzyme YgiQ (UPF0313 family)